MWLSRLVCKVRQPLPAACLLVSSSTLPDQGAEQAQPAIREQRGNVTDRSSLLLPTEQLIPPPPQILLKRFHSMVRP